MVVTACAVTTSCLAIEVTVGEGRDNGGNGPPHEEVASPHMAVRLFKHAVQA